MEMNSKVTLEYKLAVSENGGGAGGEIKRKKGKMTSLAVVLKVVRWARPRIQIDRRTWRVFVPTYLSHHR